MDVVVVIPEENNSDKWHRFL